MLETNSQSMGVRYVIPSSANKETQCFLDAPLPSFLEDRCRLPNRIDIVPGKASNTEQIDLNQENLDSLRYELKNAFRELSKGAIAQIIEKRRSGHRFRESTELLAIRGVSPLIFENIQARVCAGLPRLADPIRVVLSPHGSSEQESNIGAYGSGTADIIAMVLSEHEGDRPVVLWCERASELPDDLEAQNQLLSRVCKKFANELKLPPKNINEFLLGASENPLILNEFERLYSGATRISRDQFSTSPESVVFAPEYDRKAYGFLSQLSDTRKITYRREFAPCSSWISSIRFRQNHFEAMTSWLSGRDGERALVLLKTALVYSHHSSELRDRNLAKELALAQKNAPEALQIVVRGSMHARTLSSSLTAEGYGHHLLWSPDALQVSTPADLHMHNTGRVEELSRSHLISHFLTLSVERLLMSEYDEKTADRRNQFQVGLSGLSAENLEHWFEKTASHGPLVNLNQRGKEAINLMIEWGALPAEFFSR